MFWHAGFLKNDGTLAQTDGVAAFDGLHGPILAGKVSRQGLEASLGNKKLFRLAPLHDGLKRPGVVKFKVVADDIVDFFRIQHLGHAAQQGAFAAGGHRVHQNIFFVFDKIGVVRGAIRGSGIPVEVPVVVVHVAYPEYVFFNFNRLHLFTPECGVFPFTKSPALPHTAAKRGESK